MSRNRPSHRRTEDGSTSDRPAESSASRRRFVAATLAAGTFALGMGSASAATVTDTSFTVGTTSERPSDRVTVGYADGTVTVDGRIGVSNPCVGVRLGSASFDGDTLGVTVSQLDREPDQACPTVVSSVEYVATVDVDERPASVVVTHERFDTWSQTFDLGEPGAPGPVGSKSNAPTDPDGDDLYEDVNGNGEQDFDDVVELFQNRTTDADVQPQWFDFGGNDQMDFDDVVKLYQENTG